MIFNNMDWAGWVKGLWAAVIGGGANAVVSAYSLNMRDPNHFNAQSADFYGIVGTLFASSAIVSFFMYLKQSPLPQVVSKIETTTTTVVQKTPTQEKDDTAAAKFEEKKFDAQQVAVQPDEPKP